ncbi:hypothetical protein ISCGN_019397 [Ixodes scapularis]
MSLVMSEIDAGKHDDAVEFLSEALDLFKRLTIQGSGKKPARKPVQTDVLITTAALSIQDLYFKENGFRYLHFSRFSQNAPENLFNIVRQKNTVPRPVQFKTALRTIALSVFSTMPHRDP